MKDSPCFGTAAGSITDCPDRHPGCHKTCERYIAWKAEISRTRAQPYYKEQANGYKLDAARKRKRGRSV